MFRRRPPRRPRVRPGPAQPQQFALRALRQAHGLMETGQYDQAYPILKRLADGAAQRGMPVRAANLYLRAGRARLEMGNVQEAVTLIRRAMQLLVRAGQVERVGALLPRAIRALEEKGYRDEAALLRGEIEAMPGDARPVPSASRRGTLPTQCPSCNGPVRSDEVTWIDERSAECVYCGSVIQTE